MTDRESSSSSNGSSNGSAFVAKRGGYSPTTGQLLPAAPSTSTGESGSTSPTAQQAAPAAGQKKSE